MGDFAVLDNLLPEAEKKSLKLRPLEQLRNESPKIYLKLIIEKKIHSNGTILPHKVTFQRFEIEGPSNQKSLLNFISPLLKLGIKKAKIYVTEASNEAINGLIVVAPVVTQNLWSRCKSYLSSFFQGSDEEEKRLILEEEEDYYLIKKRDEEAKIVKESIEENYEILGSSLGNSSFIYFGSSKLKTINELRAKDENFQDSFAVDLCESMIIMDSKKYNNSFNISEDSIAYAPEATSSSFRAINCRAAEFELVGNKIYVRDIESIIGAQIFENESDVEQNVV